MSKSSVFFNIVQTAFDPPPPSLVLNIYVADYIADYSGLNNEKKQTIWLGRASLRESPVKKIEEEKN